MFNLEPSAAKHVDNLRVSALMARYRVERRDVYDKPTAGGHTTGMWELAAEFDTVEDTLATDTHAVKKADEIRATYKRQHPHDATEWRLLQVSVRIIERWGK